MTAAASMPGAPLSSGKPMPRIGMGTASFPFAAEPEAMKEAILRAIKVGYRHFDTASVYASEAVLGEAVAEAVCSGLIASRDELFITSKLWCSDAHRDLVVPAMRKTLESLQMEYIDLYLIHFPVSLKPGGPSFPFPLENLMLMDIRGVWEAMEECQMLGLTKAIGVSNFTCKKLEELLSFAKIPPAVNQVEVSPVCWQKKLREFCVDKGIQLCAYSTLGAKGTPWANDSVMDCEVLKEIAQARGKTVAQICLRWVYEQGDCILVKSFNEKRMRENLDIFDWELSEEDHLKISDLPQCRGATGVNFVHENGPYKTPEEFWDGEM